MKFLPRVMLVTDRHRTAGRDLAWCVERAVAGGVTLVQLREKDLSEKQYLELLEKMAGNATVLVNNRPEIARRYGTGLHLPASAPSCDDPPRPLGRSAHDQEEIESALLDLPDYIVLGTVFPTVSKPGLCWTPPRVVRISE